MKQAVFSFLAMILMVSAAPPPQDDPSDQQPRGKGAIVRRYINAPFNSGSDWMQFNATSTEGEKKGALAVSASNVNQLRTEWQMALPEVVDGSPAYVSNVEMEDGTYDVLFMTSMAGRLIAADAHLGVILWSTNPPPGPRWTTSSPAVDPNRKFVYSYGLDGYVHKYAIIDGHEVTGDGWPELITLKGSVEKGSSALSVATAKNGASYLYVTTAGYPDPGDAGDYQGHLVTIDLATGKQNIFNAACSDKSMHFVENGDATNDCAHVQSGIWARAGAVYDPQTDRVFISIGNGVFDAHHHGNNWGSSVVALRSDGSSDHGTPLDSYTPTNFQKLTDEDLDLSSTAVAIIPVPDDSDMPHLGVQCGKDGSCRLLDLTNLSGKGAPRHLGGQLQIVTVPQGGEVLTRPAIWIDPATSTPWVFVSNDDGISAFTLGTTKNGPRLSRTWTKRNGGTCPIVVNGVLYYSGAHIIRALEPTTGRTLWSNGGIGNIHWQSPILVNGTLYVCDTGGYLTAYAIDARK
jgi:hypothetical protein